MRIQTILNRVEKFKSFTYGEAHFEDQPGGPAGETTVSDRASDEAAQEPGSVRDDDLPERISDVAVSDHPTGPITPQR